MVERPCQAKNHAVGCNGKGETVDHFTPKCIAKLLDWTKEQLEAPENLQHLSYACHRLKDKDTSERKKLVQRQMSGKEVTWEEIKNWGK